MTTSHFRISDLYECERKKIDGKIIILTICVLVTTMDTLKGGGISGEEISGDGGQGDTWSRLLQKREELGEKTAER